MVPPAFGPDAACMAEVLWVLVWGTHLKQDEGLKHLNMLEGEGLRGSIPPLLVRKRSSWTLISEHVLAAMLVSFVSQARLAWLWGTLTL